MWKKRNRLEERSRYLRHQMYTACPQGDMDPFSCRQARDRDSAAKSNLQRLMFLTSDRSAANTLSSNECEKHSHFLNFKIWYATSEMCRVWFFPEDLSIMILLREILWDIINILNLYFVFWNESSIDDFPNVVTENLLSICVKNESYSRDTSLSYKATTVQQLHVYLPQKLFLAITINLSAKLEKKVLLEYEWPDSS